MPTVLGIVKDRTDTDIAIDQLVAQGIERDFIGLVWREKVVHKAEEVEVVTYVDHFDGPAEEARKGAWGGLLGGATAGIGSALLASAGIVLGPEIAVILGSSAAAAAAAAAAGAAGGGIAGGAIGALLGATDHDATKVVTTEIQEADLTERDGFIVTVESSDEEVESTVQHLRTIGAEDITILDGEDSRLRTHVEDDPE